MALGMAISISRSVGPPQLELKYLDNYVMIAMKVCTDILVPYRRNCNNLGDPLTLHLAPSSGQTFTLSNTLVHDHLPAKLMAFLTASGVLCVLCNLGNVSML